MPVCHWFLIQSDLDLRPKADPHKAFKEDDRRPGAFSDWVVSI